MPPTIYFFDPSGNRLETFGGYTAYQMDPDCRAITWTRDQIGPAVFYYSMELNQTFLSVYTSTGARRGDDATNRRDMRR